MSPFLSLLILLFMYGFVYLMWACACAKSLSHVRLFVTPWTIACQAPRFMGFSRHEYWNGLPFSSPRYLHDPGIKPASLLSPALAGGFFTITATWEALMVYYNSVTFCSFLFILSCFFFSDCIISIDLQTHWFFYQLKSTVELL